MVAMVTALGKAGKMVFQAQIRLLLLLSPEMMFYRNRYVCKPGGTLHMHALIIFLKPACSDIDIQSYGYTSSNNR